MDKEATFARFKQAVDYLKDRGRIHKQQDIADALGIGKANFSRIYNGHERYFTEGFVERFSDAYRDYINKEWLLTGEGEIGVPDKTLKPHIPVSASAGFLGGDSVGVDVKDVEYNTPIPGIRDYDFTIDVSGDSMVPKYYNKDTLACRRLDNWNEIKPWRNYVIDSRDGVLVKTITSTTLSSLVYKSINPKYPQNQRLRREDVFGIAEVVGSVRNEEKVDDFSEQLQPLCFHIDEEYFKAMYELAAKTIKENITIDDNCRRERIDQLTNSYKKIIKFYKDNNQ